MRLSDCSLAELGRLIRSREVSAAELTEHYLERIERIDPKVRAYISVLEAEARRKAAEADRILAAGGGAGPLTGIPAALKDNICLEGAATTCASRMLENFYPPYSATAAEKLLRAGAVVLGKLNMDEFAMGSSTEHSAFFPTHNPWDTDRVPGGSSGGAAAAVAAGLAPYAIGSDTGGSIRQPASFCGVVGMKPTYGAVSRYGLVAFASSLDQIGPLTRTVADNALVLEAIAGYDPRDSTSVPDAPAGYAHGLENGVRGLKIGLPKEFFTSGLAPGVEKAVRDSVRRLEALGAETGECSLPHMDYALAAYYLIATAECSSNLARYDGVRYGLRAPARDMIGMFRASRSAGFGPEVKRRVMLGTYVLSSGYYDAYYLRAQKVRTLIREDYERVFAEYDVILSPTAPTAAYRLGEISDPLTMYMGDIYTIPVNLAGLPGISLPAGLTDGLPVGVQLIGRHFEEALLYRAAYALEQSGVFTARPALAEAE
ncbi:MAG: Asp-tRNA(Asn)/Glu-tRNA(Gln) amidotransferase subunit GatA [Gracilibacteraceae bacterium]|jgi:aspartyl-tRNA(Asn)/glutamyl-tRNA(Gln) amidotransferase subunit A|nr:Asp-tRNA(Asn)/Glu-tRNA(Gln) amidotransferase subunit GatA [Gracilibacteraceae bacterium]